MAAHVCQPTLPMHRHLQQVLGTGFEHLRTHPATTYLLPHQQWGGSNKGIHLCPFLQGVVLFPADRQPGSV